MAEADLAPVLTRNIEAIEGRRRREDEAQTPTQRLARGIAAAIGTMGFAYANAALFAAWIVVNRSWTPFHPFDSHLQLLTGLASIEAIFLSIFVLINQRREARAADQRADLDLQIGLLSEHEVTRLITLVAAVADRLGVEGGDSKEMAELQKDVAPEIVLDELQDRQAREHG